MWFQFEVSKDRTSIYRIKYIEVAYLWIQEKHIHTEKQPADTFNNDLSRTSFEYLKSQTELLPAMSYTEERSQLNLNVI